MNNYSLLDLSSKKSRPWEFNPVIPPESVKPRILSVVASVRLGCALNLEKIATICTDLHYNKDSFTPLKMVLRNPYAVGMVFASGNMVITGTTSVAQCKVAALKLSAQIMVCGFPIRSPITQIQNITASVDMGFKIKLNELSKCELLKKFVMPSENYSGLTIQLQVPKTKVIIFQTGKAIITGATKEEDIKGALEVIYPFAKLYKLYGR